MADKLFDKLVEFTVGVIYLSTSIFGIVFISNLTKGYILMFFDLYIDLVQRYFQSANEIFNILLFAILIIASFIAILMPFYHIFNFASELANGMLSILKPIVIRALDIASFLAISYLIFSNSDPYDQWIFYKFFGKYISSYDTIDNILNIITVAMVYSLILLSKKKIREMAKEKGKKD